MRTYYSLYRYKIPTNLWPPAYLGNFDNQKQKTLNSYSSISEKRKGGKDAEPGRENTEARIRRRNHGGEDMKKMYREELVGVPWIQETLHTCSSHLHICHYPFSYWATCKVKTWKPQDVHEMLSPHRIAHAILDLWFGALTGGVLCCMTYDLVFSFLSVQLTSRYLRHCSTAWKSERNLWFCHSRDRSTVQ